MVPILALATSGLLFASWLFLLLVSLSAPVIKNINFFEADLPITIRISGFGPNGRQTTVVVEHLKYGIWGGCYQTQIFGTIYSLCNHDGMDVGVDHPLVRALYVHPAACALTFLALLSFLVIVRVPKLGVPRTRWIPAVTLTTLAAILSTILIIMDIILIADVKQDVDQSDGAIGFTWGNAVWLTLAAVAGLWMAFISCVIHIYKNREVHFRERHELNAVRA
ncbi:hypothetical protein K474DRAFT_21099 [Panus rudis PR-1116 ss-1]|nr:hypothetical protein K474DRAFT_21099 [Panus rudis PR-1116 ss-1]